jgi:hypothetical protein
MTGISRWGQCIRAVLAESREGRPAVARHVDFIAVLKQGLGDHASDRGIVIDDKDAPHSYLSAADCVPHGSTRWLEALVVRRLPPSNEVEGN